MGMLDLGDHSAGLVPAGLLVEEALVPHHWLLTGPPHGPGQQPCHVPLQAVVRGKTDRLRHATLPQCLVDLRLGEGRIGPKGHCLASLLLTRDLREQPFVPVLGAVDVAGP
jgi:hypothetical protein